MKQEFTHNLDPRPQVPGGGRVTERRNRLEQRLEDVIFEADINRSKHIDYSWYNRRPTARHREFELLDGEFQALRTGQTQSFTLEHMVAAREYLAVGDIRKENKDNFLSLSKEGRIEFIGIEIQQELFLSGEEAFFWNVEIGHDMVEKLGAKSSKALYIPDTFGFPDSMSKQARAAGYDNLIFTRGMGENVRTLGGVFTWESDDGSQILAVPMPDGYGAANKLGKWDVQDGKHIDLTYQPDKWNPTAARQLKRMLAKYSDRYAQIGVPYVLFGGGADFEKVDLDLAEIMEYSQAALQEEMPGTTVTFASLEGYLDKVFSVVDLENLNTFQGELRSSAEHPILRGVDSTRMPIKQAAERADREILNADTMLALSMLRERHDTSQQYTHSTTHSRSSMYEIKKELLPVLSHDAITGCCTDDVPDDLMTRLLNVENGASQVKRNSMANLAGGEDMYSNKLRHGTEVSAVNTLSFGRTQVVEIPLLFSSIPNAEHVNARTPDGEVPAQIIEKGGKKVAVVRVDVEGFGAKQIALTEAEAPAHSEEEKKQNEAENEFYKVNVLDNGSVQIQDKTTGVITHGHMFEDRADRGDEYNFDPLEDEDPVTSDKKRAKVKIISDGPVMTQIQIDMNMPLPAELNGDRDSRSAEMVSTPIQTVMTLAQGVDRVDFKTTLTNSAKDHRLRVLFKTPNAGDTVRAKEAYGITVRDAVPILGGETWREPLPIATSHSQGLLVAGDMAVFHPGLPEYEAITGPEGNVEEVALTLLRSVGWLSRGDLKTRKDGAGPGLEVPKAQLIGDHSFEYSVTMRGQEDNNKLVRRMNDYRFALEPGHKGIDLQNVLKVNGEGFVVTALKPLRDGNGVMLRLNNVNKTDSSTYDLEGMFATARRCDAIYGEPIDDEDAKSLTLGHGEIVTLRLE
jgi:mannosylglycerate hydrolase